MVHEHDDTVFIGYGGGLFATTWGPDPMTWGAHTPSELIAKLDADGIDRKRLELIVSDDLCCPDHALSARDAAAFAELLDSDVPRGP